jgi:hypothetical protein
MEDLGSRVWKLEQEAGTAFQKVEHMHHDLYGNGQPGLLKQTATFMDSFKGAERERQEQEDKRHRSNTTKLNFIMAMVAIATLIVAIFAIWVSVQLAHHAIVDPLQFFHAMDGNQVYSAEDSPPPQISSEY